MAIQNVGGKYFGGTLVSILREQALSSEQALNSRALPACTFYYCLCSHKGEQGGKSQKFCLPACPHNRDTRLVEISMICRYPFIKVKTFPKEYQPEIGRLSEKTKILST